MAKKPKDYGTGVPVYIIQSLARCLLPDILAFYESEEGQQEFTRWEAERARGNKPKKGKGDLL